MLRGIFAIKVARTIASIDSGVCFRTAETPRAS
jgi:hypothetical protein